MTKRMAPGYQLFNETDGILVSPEIFKTRVQAEGYAEAFRQRFSAQGYYLTAQGERILPRDIGLVILAVDR